MGDVAIRLTLLERSGEWDLICQSDLGSTRVTLPAPFTPDDVERTVLDVERAIVRSASPVVTRRSASPDRTARDLGRRLSDVLLAGEIRTIFDRCREKARQDGSELTVLLTPDGRSVSRLPWEFALDPRTGDDYLALRVGVARLPLIAEPIPALQVRPPLRVLGVLARPGDLPALEAEREKQQISAAFSQVTTGLVELRWLPGDRWTDLARELASGRGWHVLHFIGHGGFDDAEDSGFLELTGDDGLSRRVYAADIGRTLSRNPHLRLVVLNACESATAGPGGPFTSTAAKIMREGIPAVVAMQYEISDPAALAFASAFYEDVARGRPVDQAVTQARETVKVTLGSLEWATPILMLASPGAQIFDVTPPAASPAAPPAASPAAPPAAPASPVATSAPPVPPPGTTAASGRGAAPAGDVRRHDWTRDLRERLAQVLQQPATPTPAGDGRGIVPGAAATSPAVSPAASPAVSPAVSSGAASGAFSGASPGAGPWSGHGFAATIPPPGVIGQGSTRADPAGPTHPVGPPPSRTGTDPGPDDPRIAVLPAAPLHLAVGPRDLIAVACADGSVRVWSADRPRQVACCTVPAGRHPHRLAWSPWPRQLASVDDRGEVAVWDLETEVAVRTLRPPGGVVHDLAFTADGRYLALAGGDGITRLYDAAGRQVRAVPERPAVPHRGPLAFTPDGRGLLIACDDGQLRQYDAHGAVRRSWQHPRPLVALAVSVQRVATATADGRLRLWTWDGRVVARSEESARVGCLAFAPEGRLLAAGSTDGALRVLDPTGRVLAETGTSGPVVGTGFCAARVVAGTTAGVLELHPVRPSPGTAPARTLGGTP